MFYGYASAICLRYCNNKDEAMEVVNDGFLKIFRELHNFKPTHENYDAALKAWMKTIFIHTAIDHYRKNKKNYLVGEMEKAQFELSGSGETAIDKMSYTEIMEMVQRLSPVYKTVFNLFVIDGFRHEEIARQLNITTGTSKSNLAKARANIQKMLMEVSIKSYERKAI